MNVWINLTPLDMLIYVRAAVSPWSTYVLDKVNRGLTRRVSAGRVLRALRRCEQAGFIKCTAGPNGYYGFRWEITDQGREALNQLDAKSYIDD